MVHVQDILSSRIILEGSGEDIVDVTGQLHESFRNLKACYFHPERRSCPENGIACGGKVHTFSDDFMKQEISVYGN